MPRALAIFLLLSPFFWLTNTSAQSTSAACLTCSFPMAPEAMKPGRENICEDLFGAACLGKDGKPKYLNRIDSLTSELRISINHARDKTAQAMGFKNFEAAMRARFKEEGLELVVNPDQYAWSVLKREVEISSDNSLFGEKLYTAAATCEQKVKALRAVDYSAMTEPQKLESLKNEMTAFQAQQRQMLVKARAKDIPVFMILEFSALCNSLKASPASFKREENREVYRVCENIPLIRRQAIEIFRLEGSPEYTAKAEKFVRDYTLPPLKFSLQSSSSNTYTNPTAAPATKTEVESLREQVASLRSQLDCLKLSVTLQNSGAKVFATFSDEINKQKTTIDSLIDSFYSDENLKSAKSMLGEARRDVQAVVAQFVKDPVKRNEINDGYDKLELYWMEKPPESAYKKNDRGQLILDSTQSTPAYNNTLADNVFTRFSDPGLSFFTSLNANYLPKTNFGNLKSSERVNMMPAFLHTLDKSPYAFLATVAHEVAHKVGPDVAKVNGYDLRSEYKDLLACYKNKTSINLQDEQADETIADNIAAEVLAIQISKLPERMRRPALLSSMEAFCSFDELENQKHSVVCNGVHPAPSLRISGVFGANPNLRNVIGCEGESTKYKSCGLPIAMTSDESSTSKGTSDSQGTEK